MRLWWGEEGKMRQEHRREEGGAKEGSEEGKRVKWK